MDVMMEQKPSRLSYINLLPKCVAIKFRYRQFISKEVSRNPSLLHKVLSVPFQKFIGDTFIHRDLFDPSHRFVVIIDGLDECDNPHTQRDFFGLISDFCLTHTIHHFFLR